MVTPADLGALAATRGIELRPGIDAIVTTGASLGSLIDLSEDLGLVILGLDGLQQDGAAVVPLLDFIADFSEIEGPRASRVHASASAAREVTGDWGPMPDFVEVTLEGLDA